MSTLAKDMTLLGALYNFSGACGFVIPGVLPMLGVEPPHSPMWLWLPALVLTYNSIVLYLCSKNLKKYAAFVYWNALIRCIFAVISIAGNFGATAGAMMGMIAYGDIVIGSVSMWSIQSSCGLSVYQLLSNDYTIDEKTK